MGKSSKNVIDLVAKEIKKEADSTSSFYGFLYEDDFVVATQGAWLVKLKTAQPVEKPFFMSIDGIIKSPDVFPNYKAVFPDYKAKGAVYSILVNKLKPIIEISKALNKLKANPILCAFETKENALTLTGFILFIPKFDPISLCFKDNFVLGTKTEGDSKDSIFYIQLPFFVFYYELLSAYYDKNMPFEIDLHYIAKDSPILFDTKSVEFLVMPFSHED